MSEGHGRTREDVRGEDEHTEDENMTSRVGSEPERRVVLGISRLRIGRGACIPSG